MTVLLLLFVLHNDGTMARSELRVSGLQECYSAGQAWLSAMNHREASTDVAWFACRKR